MSTASAARRRRPTCPCRRSTASAVDEPFRGRPWHAGRRVDDDASSHWCGQADVHMVRAVAADQRLQPYRLTAGEGHLDAIRVVAEDASGVKFLAVVVEGEEQPQL